MKISGLFVSSNPDGQIELKMDEEASLFLKDILTHARYVMQYPSDTDVWVKEYADQIESAMIAMRNRKVLNDFTSMDMSRQFDTESNKFFFDQDDLNKIKLDGDF